MLFAIVTVFDGRRLRRLLHLTEVFSSTAEPGTAISATDVKAN
jgi:hypothetical protein